MNNNINKRPLFFPLINWTMYRNIHFTMYFSPVCEELANWIMSIALKQDLFSTWCKTGKLYGQIHLPLTNRSPLKVLYTNLFCFSPEFDKTLSCFSTLCVLQLHQVSFWWKTKVLYRTHLTDGLSLKGRWIGPKAT